VDHLVMRVPAHLSAERLIVEYLSRVTVAGLHYLPKGGRIAFVSRTRDRIEQETGPAAEADPARVREVLARLGDPEDLVRAERARLDAERVRQYSRDKAAGEAEAAEIVAPLQHRRINSRYRPATRARPQDRLAGGRAAAPEDMREPRRGGLIRGRLGRSPVQPGPPVQPGEQATSGTAAPSPGDAPAPAAGEAAGSAAPGAAGPPADTVSPAPADAAGPAAGAVSPAPADAAGPAAGAVSPAPADAAGPAAGAVSPAPADAAGPAAGAVSPAPADASGPAAGPAGQVPGGTAGQRPEGPGQQAPGGSETQAPGETSPRALGGAGAQVSGGEDAGGSGRDETQQLSASGTQSLRGPVTRAPGWTRALEPVPGESRPAPGQSAGGAAPDSAGPELPASAVPPAPADGSPASPHRPLRGAAATLGRGATRLGWDAVDVFRQWPLESVVVVLIGLGGLILPVVFWPAGGLVALWSRTWDARDKWVALLGPAVILLLGTVVIALIIGGNGDAVVAYWHALRLDWGYLLRIGGLLCAAYLVLRVRRGPRKQRVPPWRR
jgi:hypothetical protein